MQDEHGGCVGGSAVAATGDELVAPGGALERGQIFESNGTHLAATLTELGVEVRGPVVLADERAAFTSGLDELARGSDLIILTGGVSVGDFDVSRIVLQDSADGVFRHVRMQPGKPQGWARWHGVPVLAFPGNPVSALVVFEVMIRPLIRITLGRRQPMRRIVKARTLAPITSIEGRKGFLRAQLMRDEATGEYLVQALGGAKNHMLVLPDADLDLAADAAVNAGYGAAGERCMAISVVLATDAIADELVAKIAERTRTLRTGDGMGESDMGPLVTRAHLDKVTGYVEEGVAAGAELVIDGREGAGDLGGGFFLKPTLFDRVTPEMSIYTDEIFGPVLSVVRVGSYDEGLQLINDNPYGNGTAIFTNDGGAARRFQHEVEVGMVGINVPIPVPMAYYSFGGWKNSLFGDTHAHGIEGVHFFTRTKAVTQRWLDPSHGGLNLGFPQND